MTAKKGSIHMTDIEKISEALFEDIKHLDEQGNEYWTARELIPVLEYNEYHFFKKVIDKAIDACKSSNIKASDHIVHVHDMVALGSGAERKIEDFHLSRYACYLIAMKCRAKRTPMPRITA